MHQPLQSTLQRMPLWRAAVGVKLPNAWLAFSSSALWMRATSAIHSTTASKSDTAQDILDRLVNYEQTGVPSLAGTTQSKTFDLQRMHRLLRRLGNPQSCWPVVHVAGTKGKGSTVAMLAACLRAAGLRVGVYTSPHVHHLRERMSVLPGGEPIPSPLFESLLATHRGVLEACQQEERGALSHFEAVTGLAFRYFADERVDIAVVETGLGGTTDATNVLDADKLQAAVITTIGMEHVAALGGSLASIASAKAGIMKPGRPVVLSHQQEPEALEVLQTTAQQLGCDITHAQQRVVVHDRGYEVDASSSHIVSHLVDLQVPGPHSGGSTAWLEGIKLRMVGPHQAQNVCTAVATLLDLRKQGWSVPDAAVRAGLEAAWLPGRFQVMPLPGGSPAGTGYLVLDGAHTAASAAALVQTLGAVFPGKPVALVVAMAADKDHRAVIAELRRARPKVVVFASVPIAGSYHRAAPPGTLAGHWQAAAMQEDRATQPFRCRELIQASIGAAIAKARQELRAFEGKGVVVVTGSLHAVAHGEHAAVASQQPT